MTSQLGPVRSGAVWVNKRGLTFGRFPGGDLESKNKIKATQTLGLGSSKVEGLDGDFSTLAQLRLSYFGHSNP